MMDTIKIFICVIYLFIGFIYSILYMHNNEKHYVKGDLGEKTLILMVLIMICFYPLNIIIEFIKKIIDGLYHE